VSADGDGVYLLNVVVTYGARKQTRLVEVLADDLERASELAKAEAISRVGKAGGSAEIAGVVSVTRRTRDLHLPEEGLL
jgi:hypothetical protein